MSEFQEIFPRGGENTAFARYFVGRSYLNMLSTEQVSIGNVTFEPGCRNNWHIHHASKGGGQILLCTAGRGWYQEWGKPARALQAGDVVNIPANVKHWHGAARDSWFVHLAVEVPGEETANEWLEPVSDADYSQLDLGRDLPWSAENGQRKRCRNCFTRLPPGMRELIRSSCRSCRTISSVMCAIPEAWTTGCGSW